MHLRLDQLKELCKEHWELQEYYDSIIASGEHIPVIIFTEVSSSNLNEQEARYQLAVNAPAMAQALINLIDTATNTIIESNDQKAFNALHEAFHVLKKILQ
jgi:hypothetical protein